MTTSQADINTNSNNNTTKSATTAIAGGQSGGGGGGDTRDYHPVGNNGSGVGISPSTTYSTVTLVNSNGSKANFAADGGDMGKRKKLKSRNSNAVPITPFSGLGYSKDHLDAWLETCLKDACTTQYSSSSEFLDYNPTSAGTATQQQQQQQQQLQHLQQQQQSAFNMANMNQSQQQQQFAMRTNSTPNSNLPNSNNSFNNFPFSQGFQKNLTNFMKPTTTSSINNMMFTPMSGNGSGNSFYAPNNGSQDFASLPPMVNIMSGGGGSGGNSSEQENNATDVLDSAGNSSFRFSDPCLMHPTDTDFKGSGHNTPDHRHDLNSESDQKAVFNILMEQIQHLNETNAKICRDLHEAKVCIEVLKHAPHLGMRHRRDSISGLSTHSQPMVFGSGFGTHSPAPSFHSGAYTPGIMTDVVREVKDAARMREDALLNRVKALVEERQWSMNESNLRMMRDIEELKSVVHHLRLDRKDTNKRLNHLEAENKYMRQMLAALYNNRTVPDIIYENEALRTRKHFPTGRRSQAALSLHYGTVHHQQAANSSLDEQDEEPLHIVETPSTSSTADIATLASRPVDMRQSFSTSDDGSVNGGLVSSNQSIKVAPIMSPPNFALISSPNEEIVKRKKDMATKKTQVETTGISDTTHELRRELSEAVAARKEADDRIIALEKLVKTLQVNAIHPPSSSTATNTTTSTTNNNVYDLENPTTPPTTSIATKITPPRQLSPLPKIHHHHQQQQQQQSPPQQQQLQQQSQSITNGDGDGVGGGHQLKSKLAYPTNINSSGGGHNKIINKRCIPTPASRGKWSSQQTQQQQQQQQQQQAQQHHQVVTQSGGSSAQNSPVKLSVAGPITDL